LSRWQLTSLNIAALHYGICVLLLAANVSIIWILIQFVYSQAIFIALTIQFMTNGLGLLVLIRCVRRLYFTAQSTITTMESEFAKACQKRPNR